MSEIDHVFARMGGGQSTQGEQREQRSIPRRGGATGNRVVEVVRLPGKRGAGGPEPAQRAGFKVHAQSWAEGFPARSVAPAHAAPPPEPAEAPAEPVAHVMPMWERTAEPEPEIASEPTPEPPPQPARRGRPPGPRRTAAERRIADPFDSADDGANCLRCGYMVEPARERRGLLTCAACA